MVKVIMKALSFIYFSNREVTSKEVQIAISSNTGSTTREILRILEGMGCIKKRRTLIDAPELKNKTQNQEKNGKRRLNLWSIKNLAKTKNKLTQEFGGLNAVQN